MVSDPGSRFPAVFSACLMLIHVTVGGSFIYGDTYFPFMSGCTCYLLAACYDSGKMVLPFYTFLPL